jgi:hypothetical protein
VPLRRVRQALHFIDDRLGRRALVWGALLALGGLGLSFVPLFDVLGYDYAFALGLGTAFAAADLGHGAVAAARRRAGGPLRLEALVLTAVLGALGLLVLPLLVSLLNGLRVRNCSFSAGLAFYALLPVASAVYASVGGMLAGWALPRRGRLLAVLLPLLSLGWAAWRLYDDPPVFAFDPFGGYFPGPIYDEALRPPERLLHYRLVNAVWLAAAVAVAVCVRTLGQLRRDPGALRRWRLGGQLALTGGLVVLSVLLYRGRAGRGFHLDEAALQAVLRRETRSPHFIVHSDPRGDGTPEDRTLLMQDLEFRYHQLEAVLGIAPAGPVSVYLFPSAEAKKTWVGAGGTLYAKPWKRQIFVQLDRFPARRLRHELAHVFAGAFGDPLFGISLAWRLPFPRLASGLVEGAAEAADFGDPDGRATIHQEARAMIAAGLAPPLAKVMGASFTTVAGARAYTMAGSFSHFLLSAHGPEKFRAIYRSGGDFPGVYGRSLADLEGDWRRFLETQPLDEQDRARAKERFRRPAIFAKVCARDLAARVGEARERLYSLPDEAVALLRSVCADDPGEPSHRLDLAEALFAAGASAPALAEAGQVAALPDLTRPMEARAASLTASIHYHAGRYIEAAAATRRALAAATEEGEQRTALARLRALEDERARATLGRVLFGESPTRGVDPALVVFLIERFTEQFPDEALGPYLMARQLTGRDPRLASASLDRACPLDVNRPAAAKPLPPLFAEECRRMTAENAFRAGDLGQSRRAWAEIRNSARTQADRLRATDFLERIAWEERRRQAGRLDDRGPGRHILPP